jgi:hypothetical protein
MRRPGGARRNLGPDSLELVSSQYLDDIVDDYVSWREACDVVAAAYAHWKCAAREEQKLAFSEYVAALNCEEEAALVYQQAVERLATTAPDILKRRR